MDGTAELPTGGEPPDEQHVAVADPPAPMPGSRRWYRRPRILLPAIAGVVVFVVAVLVLNATPRTFALHGSIDLKRIGVASDGTGGCKGVRGYDDMGEGTTVIVYDSTGQSVAVGALGQGTLTGLACRFPFDVENVPAGSGSYSVEVSHRGKLTFGADQAQNGPIAMTLG